MNEARFLRALHSVTHRGPDDFAFSLTELSADWELWLGHRRLSILDLRASGRQPMLYSTPAQEYAIIFNGEIYNHNSLRTELQTKVQFQSETDTEVLLVGLAQQGTAYLEQLNGMWAFAFLDKQQKKLLLSRDRLGKKPLYCYRSSEDLIVFASELKPFRELGLPLSLDDEALAFYHWLGYIPASKTIYKEISKVPAASFCEIDLNASCYKISQPQLFWDPIAAYGTRFTGSYNEAIDHFLHLLDDATALRSVADVPVGVFLSGGIDSSLVVASLAAQQKSSVKAFTVAFSDQDFDESAIAKDTCAKLGFDLELLQLASADFERQFKILTTHYDEPFADSSQIPILAISEIAKSKVTVILTGDGGDEVFLGYPRFAFPERFWKYRQAVARLPGLGGLLGSVMGARAAQPLMRALVKSTGSNPNNLDAKITRFLEVLRSRTKSEIYDAIVAVTPKRFLSQADQALLQGHSFEEQVRAWYPSYAWDALNERSPLEKIAALDLVSYMRDDVLVKVDRGTMAYSVEARSPLLDWRIVAFGLSLPLSYKVREGQCKALLRSALERRVPGKLSRLAKRGFGVPLPNSLPAGMTMASRWNAYVEKAWREKYA